MKRILVFLIMLPTLVFQLKAQKQLVPETLLKALEGSFKWEMYNAENNLLRTGSKTTILTLDNKLLRSQEEFDDSNIRMEGLFGYNEKTKKFFTVSVFNVDPGPHLAYAQYLEGLKYLEFIENDSTKTRLEVFSKNEHLWTSFKKEGTAWNQHLRIRFKRD